MKETTTGSASVPKLKALVYGVSKSGKTMSALTLDDATTLIISCEAGLLPLRGKNFDVLEVESWDDLTEVYARLGKEEYQKKYKTIFLDSITEMNELCKAKILAGDRAIDGGNKGERVNKDLLLQSDYQLLESRMVKMMRKFRDLPYHVIMTALVNSQENKQTGDVRFIPSLNGKLAANSPAYFDLVLYMVARSDGSGRVERNFVTAPVERSIAGCRTWSGVELKMYEPPHWGALMRKVLAVPGKPAEEGKTESEKPAKNKGGKK